MGCSQFCKASAIITVASLLAHQTGAQPASGDEYTYVGCFKDTKEDRILGDQLTNGQEMTTEFCYNYCIDLGALWMATQYAIECWCTNEVELDYARHGAGAQCNYDCAGDESEFCGGFDAFDLYRIDSDSITSDGDTAPTPVDGETNNEQGNGTEGDGDTAPTPVDGETNNDQGNGTEGGNDYTYVGCFKDSQQDRILGDQLTNSQEMTTEFCYDYCITKDATLMATQYAIECWCTSEPEDQVDYARHGEGAQCNYDCAGDESCGGLNAFDLYRIGAAYTTSDGDTAPTPVDGETNNDQGNGIEGDGGTAPTPVDGETNNDQGNGTEGDGGTAPTPVDGETNNDQGNGTEGDGGTAPTPVDGETNNDQGNGTEGSVVLQYFETSTLPSGGRKKSLSHTKRECDLGLSRSEVDGEGRPAQHLEQSSAPVPTSILTPSSVALRANFVCFSISCRRDGGTAPTPVDGETNNDQGNGTEGDGGTAPTPVDGEAINDQDNGTEGGMMSVAPSSLRGRRVSARERPTSPGVSLSKALSISNHLEHQRFSAPVPTSTLTPSSVPLRANFVCFSISSRRDGGTAPRPSTAKPTTIKATAPKVGTTTRT
ncbi:unnamed protein product [Ectocarpus sp. 6 AP-2014]